MTGAADAVLAQALKLDPIARAELAAELIATLDGPPDPDAEAAWMSEVEQRVRMLESGNTRAQPWQNTKSRIEREIRER